MAGQPARQSIQRRTHTAHVAKIGMRYEPDLQVMGPASKDLPKLWITCGNSVLAYADAESCPQC